MTCMARCLVPLPIAGSGPVATTARSHGARWVTIHNQPLKTYAPPGGYDYHAKSKRRPFQALSSVVSTWLWRLSKCLQQVKSQHQTRMHCLDGAKLKSICRTVQVLPECLRLRKVPAVHCNIAKTKDQPEIQNTDHSPNEWASWLTADPRRKLTIHVRRLCCSRALQTVQQRVPLVRTSVTRCSAAWSMAPAGYDLLPLKKKK